MRTKYLFEFDIEVDRDGDSDGRWFSWSNITTEGDTLDDLLDNAQIGKVDQDGGDFGLGPADANWMQDLIESAYEKECRRRTESAREYATDKAIDEKKGS